MDPMTNKQALAFARHELEYYKQVERDGIRMTKHIEFYEIVVKALELIETPGRQYCGDCKHRSEAEYRQIKDRSFYRCMKHNIYVTRDSSCDKSE